MRLDSNIESKSPADAERKQIVVLGDANLCASKWDEQDFKFITFIPFILLILLILLNDKSFYLRVLNKYIHTSTKVLILLTLQGLQILKYENRKKRIIYLTIKLNIYWQYIFNFMAE